MRLVTVLNTVIYTAAVLITTAAQAATGVIY